MSKHTSKLAQEIIDNWCHCCLVCNEIQESKDRAKQIAKEVWQLERDAAKWREERTQISESFARSFYSKGNW